MSDSSTTRKKSNGPFKVFMWQIENISSFIIGTNRYFRSPSFTAPSGKELELEFFTGIIESSEFSLCVQYKNSCLGNPIIPDYKITLSILTINNRNTASMSNEGNIIKGYKRLLFQPQDTLTVRCEIWHDVPLMFFARTVFFKKTFLWVLAHCDFTYNTKIFQMGSTDFVISICNYDAAGNVPAKLEQAHENGENFRFPLCKVSAMSAEGTIAGVLCEQYFINLPSSFLIQMKDEFIINGMLMLQWEFVVALEEASDFEMPPWHVTEESALPYKRISKNCLNGDLLRLYKSRELCDAVLKAEGTSFPVHRNILSARSPVFRAMFERDMEEGNTREVNITDIDKDTLDWMLTFLYADSMNVPLSPYGEINWEDISNLYYAADKYAIQHLKDKCRSILIAKLSVINVCEILVLADMHQDNLLLRIASKFVCDYPNDVINSDAWRNLQEKQPQLTSKLCSVMSMKRKI